MKQLKVRFAEPNEAETIVAWLRDNPENLFNGNILKYPTVQIVCAYNDEPVCYLPFQRVLMLESVAMKPGLEKPLAAQALRDLTKAATLIASSHQIKEMYFLAGNGGVDKLATRHEYEELPYKVFRMKL